jgi:hypothetical protein
MSDEQREQWCDEHTVHLDRIDGLRLLTDTTPVWWLGPRMHESARGALLWVPDGYEAYARIFFPYQLHELPTGYHDNPAARESEVKVWTEPWSTVASRHGKVARALMQRDPIDEGEEEGVTLDELDDDGMRALTHVLRRHTTSEDEAYILVWEGYGDLNSDWEVEPPMVTHPLQRHCYALTGPIEAASGSRSRSKAGFLQIAPGATAQTPTSPGDSSPEVLIV